MKAEELTIVGAVGRLWDKSHARLRAALDEAPNGPHEWRIGGGTILAARWGHRTSFDIDITVGRNTDLKEVRDGATQHVQALAEELQGAIVEEERIPTARLRVRFEKNQALNKCALDISRLQPEPNLRERNAKVNGVTITVLDTAQILRGKLERAEKSPVRDVFDFASASKGDPGALAIATNCLTKQYAGVIGTIWKTSNKRFANDAADYLEGVTPGWRRDTRTLGDQAAEAMEGATYERLQVHARAGTGRIVATCRNGHVNVFEIPRGRFDETLDSSGIESYLQKNAVAAYAARETMREGINRSGESEELVWSSKSWKPELGTGAGTPGRRGSNGSSPPRDRGTPGCPKR